VGSARVPCLSLDFMPVEPWLGRGTKDSCVRSGHQASMAWVGGQTVGEAGMPGRTAGRRSDVGGYGVARAARGVAWVILHKALLEAGWAGGGEEREPLRSAGKGRPWLGTLWWWRWDRGRCWVWVTS
jgi:hypothetical protein